MAVLLMEYGRDIDFDPAAAFAKLEAPVLWILGEKDPETPLQLSLERLERLRQGGENITVKVFPGADHQIELPRRQKNRPNFAPGYVETMVDWISRQCSVRQRREG